MIAMVYGGSGSGKSALAETLLENSARGDLQPIYIATMQPLGPESRARIARHRAVRADKGFRTLECYTDLATRAVSPEIPQGASVLLECLGNLVANEMFSPEGASHHAPAQTVLHGLETLAKRARRLIVVSNDVFSDGAEYAPETQDYLETLAALNRTIAARSTLVAETVCGIPLWHKQDHAWNL